MGDRSKKNVLPKKNRSKIVFFAVLFCSLSFIFLSIFSGGIFNAFAANTGAPKILVQQGRLLDSTGNLLGGAGTDYCFRFSIYDELTGGSKLWPAGSPSSMTINVKSGLFSAPIGDTSVGGDLLDYNFQDSDEIYLNVDIASKSGAVCGSFETLSPRQRIVSSPYALNSNTVGGFTPSQSATGNQIPVLTNGNLVLGGTDPQIYSAGNITIGSATGTTSIFLTKGALGNINLTNFDCTAYANGGKLTTDSFGNVICATDESGFATITGTNLDDVFSENGILIRTSTGTYSVDTNTYALSSALSGYVPTTTTVNGHALSGNISVTTTDLSLNNVENTALSTWPGSTNITTLGTVGTGTWNATAIDDTYIASAATWNAKISSIVGQDLSLADNSTSSFTTLAGVAGVGYLLATGATTGATSQAQAFTNGIITPKIYPSADSTTAVGIFKADGTTNVLNVDTTNGRVGIGTASPNGKLTIQQANDTSSGGVKLYSASGAGNASLYMSSDGYLNINTSKGLWLMSDALVFPSDYLRMYDEVPIKFGNVGDYSMGYNDATDALQFVDGDVIGSNVRMVINNQGNVGIGTTSPIAKLAVVGNAHIGGNLAIDGNAAGTNSYLQMKNNGNSFMYFGTDAGATSGSAADANLYVYGANRLFLSTGNTKRLTIDGAGNVGIGTTVPASLLEVQGGLTTVGSVLTLGTKEPTVVANDVLGRLNFYAPLEADGGDAILTGASIVARAEGTFSATNNATSLDFQTGASEVATTKMTIMSSGNVGIGTTTPQGLLHVSDGEDVGTSWKSAYDKFAFTGQDFQFSIVDTDSGTWGAQIALKQVDKTVYENAWGITRQTNGDGTGDGSMRFTYGTNVSTYINPAVVTFASGGNVGIGTTDPTAYLHLKAGTATASTAPLKFTSGTLLTAPEAGAMEFDGTQLYFSPSTTRNMLAQTDGSTALTSGSILFASTATGGYLTQDNANFF
jgi:hypothetical protein